MKECNQCGKCCIKYGSGGLTTSTSQINYWNDNKPEISQYLKDGDFWFDPKTGVQVEQCPWLRKEPGQYSGQNKYTCDIYFDRPDDCKFYPSTLDEIVVDGCEMIEKNDLKNPKQGQKSLEIIMKDSWTEFEY